MSSLIKYFILLFFGILVFTLILNTCAHVAADPVTPDITTPSTLQVTVTIAEDQDASDGTHGKSVITLGFNTNEVVPPETAIFTHGESVSCNGNTIALGNATSYWLRVAIPYNSFYTCSYHYFLQNNPQHPQTAQILRVHAAQYPLSPVLQRPVSGNFLVHYTSGPAITNSSNCTVQATANAPGQSTSGNTVPQDEKNYTVLAASTYTGSDASGLNGSGNILMTRTCTPINYNNHNAVSNAECPCYGSTPPFDAVIVTYTSTASYEVSWYSTSSPTQGTNS